MTSGVKELNPKLVQTEAAINIKSLCGGEGRDNLFKIVKFIRHLLCSGCMFAARYDVTCKLRAAGAAQARARYLDTVV